MSAARHVAMVLLVALALPLVAPSADAQRRRRTRAREARVVDAGAPVGELDGGVLVDRVDSTTADAGAVIEEVEAREPSAAGEVAPDLTGAREEVADVIDALVALRTRVASLGQPLFRTKLRVALENDSEDDAIIERVEVRVDGSTVFRGDAIAEDDPRPVFEGRAAPGLHEVTLEVVVGSRASATYRRTLVDTYRFEVRRGKITDVVFVLEDESEIGEDFPSDGEGEYDVRTRVRVATRELGAR